MSLKVFFNCKAIKCIEWGGPVEIIASTLFSVKYFFKYLTDGFTQNFLASGIKKLPLIQTAKFSVVLGFLDSARNPVLIFSLFFTPINFL